MIYDARGSSARDCFPLLLYLFSSALPPLAATSVFNDITKFVCSPRPLVPCFLSFVATAIVNAHVPADSQH